MIASQELCARMELCAVPSGRLRAKSKTGPRAVPLSPPAAKVLAELPRVPGNPWAIPGQKPDTHMTDLDDPWRTVRERAGIEKVRIHDCRHSFASQAAMQGIPLPVVARLLGRRWRTPRCK